jgi:NitT/TauT family transport system substrate-binding protein
MISLRGARLVGKALFAPCHVHKRWDTFRFAHPTPCPNLPLPDPRANLDAMHSFAGDEMRRKHRWTTLRIGLAALAMMMTCAVVRGAEPSEVTVGISEAVNTVLAFWMAEDAGFFRDQGLKVRILNMNGGGRGAQELQAGRLDIMHVGLSSVIRVDRGGGDLRLVASLSNVIRFTLFAAPGMRAAADLRGGIIGVSTFGSESDTTVTLALRRLGLARDDVTLKEYGGGPQRLAALKAGEIRATAVNEPMRSLAREEGLLAMVDLVPERIPWLFSGVVVKREMLEQRRDLLTRFLKAVMEGNLLALAEAARAKAVLAREARIADAKILDIAYEDFKQQSPRDIAPTPAAADNTLAQFPPGGAAADYIDIGILDELRAGGFVAALERKYGVR